jgi:RNA polymerase sigma factor (sigma-70 family)
MVEPTGADEADEVDDDLEDRDGAAGSPSGLKSRAVTTSEAHLAHVDAEMALLCALDRSFLAEALRGVIAGSHDISTEALVRVCTAAHQAADRGLVNLSFEALAKTATPLLLSQAWGLTKEGADDQVQQILMELFSAIKFGKSGMAGRFFAAYAKRRSISEYRKRQARFEGSFTRTEPEGDYDPLDEVSDRLPSQEALVLLQREIEKIQPEHRTAFIKYHYFEMTQQEIAKEHEVDVRTVHEWLKKAAVAVGLKGDGL